jgi:hypothetical protein
VATGSVCATITLAVHPHFGEKVAVLQAFGAEVVQVELEDGRVRLLPVRWTSLHPPSVADIQGKPVRLELQSLRELGNWVAARCASTDRRKFDDFDERGDNVVPDGAPREGIIGTAAQSGRDGGSADNEGKRRTAAAVVEQARSSRTGGRERRRARRKRRRG